MIAASLISQPEVWATSYLEVVATVIATFGLVPLMGLIAVHLICHQPGCLRAGRHPYKHFKLCAKHHPEIQGEKLTRHHFDF